MKEVERLLCREKFSPVSRDRPRQLAASNMFCNKMMIERVLVRCGVLLDNKDYSDDYRCRITKCDSN